MFPARFGRALGFGRGAAMRHHHADTRRTRLISVNGAVRIGYKLRRARVFV